MVNYCHNCYNYKFDLGLSILNSSQIESVHICKNINGYIICIMQYNMMPVTDYLTDFGVLREKTTQNLRYFINSFGYSTIIL